MESLWSNRSLKICKISLILSAILCLSQFNGVLAEDQSPNKAAEKPLNVEPTLTVAPTATALSTANPGGTVDKLQPTFIFEKSVASTEDDQKINRCLIKVTNIDALPNYLFEPAPYLKPLGENTNASRSWVYVLDGDGNPLSTFATISDRNALSKLWYATQKDIAAPKKIYIDIWDRQLDVHYRSKTVDVP